MNLPSVSLAFLALAVGGFASSPTQSSSTRDLVTPSVSVNATGTVLVAPTFFSMEAKLSVHAEIAEESVRDFRQARDRALAGLEDAEIESLEVQAGGVAFRYGKEVEEDPFNRMVVMSNSGTVDEPAPGITCEEKLAIRLSPAADMTAQEDQIADAIDIALELGLELKTQTFNPYYPQQNLRGDGGPIGGTVEGGLNDAAKAEAEAAAQAAAMQRAREQAATLANLGGRKLGQVQTINLTSLTTTWKGVGQGVEVTAKIFVTFEMQ